MDTNSKFSKFVAKLEQKMLDSNQESMILIGQTESHIWGGSNGNGCVNASKGSCGINDNKCENKNDNCGNSINSKKCINTVILAGY
jgi:hypothetical protein